MNRDGRLSFSCFLRYKHPLILAEETERYDKKPAGVWTYSYDESIPPITMAGARKLFRDPPAFAKYNIHSFWKLKSNGV